MKLNEKQKLEIDSRHGQVIDSKLYFVRDNGSLDISTVNDEPSRTQQQFKDECDVNLIIKQYRDTGEIYHLNRKQGVYLDLTQIPDYQGALETVRYAAELFDSLPAEVRKQFDNDPQKLLAFVQDPKNLEEGKKLGLFEKEVEPSDIQKLVSEMKRRNDIDDQKIQKTNDKNDQQKQ